MNESRFKAEAAPSRISDTPLDAFRLPRSGRTYDLSSGWWPGMPMLPAHPAFQLVTYRTPSGVQNQADLPFLTGNNAVNLGFVSELLMCTMHSGTHIDALAHITCGPDNCWHGGFSAKTHLGDFGPMNKDASELPPLIRRGVLIDVPGALGVPHLEAAQPIHGADIEATLERQGVEVREGDVALIRTGTMGGWPDEKRMEASLWSGLSLDGAKWLVSRGVSVVGGDNVGLDVMPSGYEGDPQPVHRYLIQEKGVPIMEWVFMEDIARDKVHEFLFIALPLPIKGATGSLIRPLAIA
jgi:kynurenine formamidase